MYYQALLPTRRLGDRERTTGSRECTDFLACTARPGVQVAVQTSHTWQPVFFPSYWCYSWLKWFLTGHSKDTVRILRLAHCVRTEHDTD